MEECAALHLGKHEIWNALHEWETSSSGWMSSAASGLDLDTINTTVDEAGVGAYTMLKARRDDQVVMRLREAGGLFRTNVRISSSARVISTSSSACVYDDLP